MGSRTQIYIHWDVNDQEGFIARYFQCSAHDIGLVSRATALVKHLSDIVENIPSSLNYEHKRLVALCETYFEAKRLAVSSDILLEAQAEHYKDLGLIFNQDNNNGQLFIELTEEGISYAFRYLTPEVDNVPFNAEQYLSMEFLDEEEQTNDWQHRLVQEGEFDLLKSTMENLQILNETAMVMTKEELAEFLARDYSKFLDCPIYRDGKKDDSSPYSIILPVRVSYDDIRAALEKNCGQNASIVNIGKVANWLRENDRLVKAIKSDIADRLDAIVCDLIYEGKI